MPKWQYAYEEVPRVNEDQFLLQRNKKKRRHLVTRDYKRVTRIMISTTVLIIIMAIIIYLVFIWRTTSCEWSDSDNIEQRRLHPMGIYSKGAVAADHPNCSIVGWDILEDGGSAVDAMIATQLCIGVVRVHSAGLGGGSVLLFYNRTEKKSYAMMSREVAPAAATATMFDGNIEASKMGGLAIAVPGELAGMWTAHQKFGVLPWNDLFQPAISLAENGFTIDESLAHAIEHYKSEFPTIPEFRDIFYDKDIGRLKTTGDTIKLIKYAKTLKKLSESDDPVKLFYKSGQIVEDILTEIARNDSIISREDLGNYTVREEEPLVSSFEATQEDFGSITLFGLPPPSSGALVAFILHVMQGYNLSVEDKDKSLTNHRLMEAAKFAFAIKSQLGDPNYSDDVRKLVKKTITNEFADYVRTSLITDATTHPSEYYEGFYSPEDGGTSHISILAPNGDAATLTTSINAKFGSKVMGSLTGIVYNSVMSDFTTAENHVFTPTLPTANLIEGGKTPMSGMSPFILVNSTSGDVLLTTGASGAANIITAISSIVTRYLWFDETLKEAVDAPRIYTTLYNPEAVKYECNFNKTLIKELKSAYGHNITSIGTDDIFGVVQTVARDSNGQVYGYSDFRKGGLPAGA